MHFSLATSMVSDCTITWLKRIGVKHKHHSSHAVQSGQMTD